MADSIWAEREIELAKGDAPYDQAYSIYKDILDISDSCGKVMDILMDLASGRPLTPLEDDDCQWKQCSEEGRYIHRRYPALHKLINEDGEVIFLDYSSVITIDEDGNEFICIPITKYVHEIFSPITLPYMPSKERFYVHIEKDDDGYGDRYLIKYLITPKHEAIIINDYIYNERS